MKKVLVIGVLSLFFALLLVGLTIADAGGNNGNQSGNGNQSDSGQGNKTKNQTGDGGTIVNKTKTTGNKTASFVPWQKRNESECPEGCECHGAVVSCKTETGKTITIEAGRSGNVITITIEKIQANTTMELEQEDGGNKTKLKAKLSNGQKSEIKIMPDAAALKALERLRIKVCSAENNCSIELKEVRIRTENRAAYEIQIERHARILALFRAKMHVSAEVDAENGEVLKVKKPWWAFIASEPEE